MYNHAKVVEKLLNLYWKVHGTMDKPPEGDDLLWCRRILEDVRDSGLVPSRDEFKHANILWNKYSDSSVVSDDVMWSLIDELITGEDQSKIKAIKLYRKHNKCSLKEAKDVIDARQKSISQGWHNVTVVNPNGSSS